jgi:hypothetical protein
MIQAKRDKEQKEKAEGKVKESGMASGGLARLKFELKANSNDKAAGKQKQIKALELFLQKQEDVDTRKGQRKIRAGEGGQGVCAAAGPRGRSRGSIMVVQAQASRAQLGSNQRMPAPTGLPGPGSGGDNPLAA